MSRALTVLLAVLLALGNAVSAQASTPKVWFPVQVDENVSWVDSFGDARGSGRTHKGVDIMAPQMQPMYAAVGGWIRRAYGGDSRDCLDGGYCTSYGFLVFGDDGRSYFYLHLNDDTPGRPNGCDHVGGAEHAFSPRLVQVLRDRGTLEPLPNSWDPSDVVRVEEGELIGYVGSSGNAGCRVDHLHFETWAGHDFRSANDRGKDNPYPIVQAAYEAGRFWDQYGPIEPAEMERIAGETRVTTAIAVAKAGFTQASVAVIAPAEVYPEALVGAPLAAILDGPVLLHWGQARSGAPFSIDAAVVEELDRLGVKDVLVLSAGDNVDASFEDLLAEASGIDRERIVRIRATDPYELSTRVAREVLAHHGWSDQESAQREGTVLGGILGEPEEERQADPAPLSPILALGEHPVEGRGWPDALAAATLAASQQVPILLTRPDALPSSIAALLDGEGFDEVRIVGGTGAISDEVEAEIRDSGHETRRLAGQDRYETALAIAGELLAIGHGLDDVYVATGSNFPDAMAAGASIAAQGRVLLLVNGSVPIGAPSVLQFLRDREQDVKKVTALGGPGAVGDDVLRVVAIHANWPDDESSSQP